MPNLTSLENRVKKLEQTAPDPDRKITFRINFPRRCATGEWFCDHIVAAKIGGRVFTRLPGESVEALEERAIEELGVSYNPFGVRMIMIDYVTAHDDNGAGLATELAH